MTFSIVARDRESGEFGVAIATARPAVGALSPFVMSHVGAAATQAIVNPRLGAQSLELMAAGATAQAALDTVVHDDEHRERRQLIVVASDGGSAGFTGAETQGWSGHLCADDVAVAGNLLVGEDTLTALMDTFVGSRGRLADRLLASMVAADAVGGDRRGRQSAALLIASSDPWPTINLRVDHDTVPLRALAELLGLWRDQWDTFALTGVMPQASPPGPPPLPLATS